MPVCVRYTCVDVQWKICNDSGRLSEILIKSWGANKILLLVTSEISAPQWITRHQLSISLYYRPFANKTQLTNLDSWCMHMLNNKSFIFRSNHIN